MNKRYLGIWFVTLILFTGCGTKVETAQDIKVIGEIVDMDIPESYSLIDNGFATEVRSQVGGTCWVYAAATSMESVYGVKKHTEISIDPFEVLKAVHTNLKTEGYFLKEGTDGFELGGYNKQVTEAISNGFGNYLLADATEFDVKKRKIVKTAIMQNGAMSVGVTDYDSKLYKWYKGYKTLYATSKDPIDHAVVLIGWDDNFPREAFKEKPRIKGAWLAQNSEGTSFVYNGYYWISYETPLNDLTTFTLTDDYSEVLSYDGGNQGVINYGEITEVANVFHKKGALRGIGTYATQDNQKMTITIYDSKFKKKIYENKVVCSLKGYHTVWLDKPLEVKDYAIAIAYEGSAPAEGKSWENDSLTYKVGINEGESFIKIGKKWYDIASSETLDKLGLCENPNNVCIKAIY